MNSVIDLARKYTLNEKGEPCCEPDVSAWACWFQSADRKVAQEMVGESEVSTVFLGIDHNFGEGSPVLWETMVFGGPLDNEVERCSGSREQAKAMHDRMVAKCKNANLAAEQEKVIRYYIHCGARIIFDKTKVSLFYKEGKHWIIIPNGELVYANVFPENDNTDLVKVTAFRENGDVVDGYVYKGSIGIKNLDILFDRRFNL